MISFTDPQGSAKVKAALKDADRRGKLAVVAAVTGIAGGEKKLRQLMDSSEDLHVMDIGMLGIHLEEVPT